MRTLKKYVKKFFDLCFQIDPIDKSNSNDLTYACDGRIVRSLSDTKKQACGVNILEGLNR